MNLLDANVWLAGIWDGHADHQKAVHWRSTADGACAMCRVSQMAVLRLLTDAAVTGAAALTRREAWKLVMRQLDDPTVVWLDEPEGLEESWRTLSSRDDKNHKVWTDDYLAAFAQRSGATLVTLDRALAGRYPSVAVETI